MRYFALLAVIFLAGCSNKLPPDSLCPKTGFIDNADKIAYLGADPAKGAAVTATIEGFKGDCGYKDKEKKEVDLNLSLPFFAQKGAVDASLKEKELPYFIAVLSPDETILQRQTFTTKISFDNDTSAGTTTEEHVIKIPLKKGEDGAYGYKVIIGFALTHDQLKYNEEHK